MTRYFYGPAFEQFPPEELLRQSVAAERAGDEWPSPADQVARMDEALGFIDRLWRGETVTERGRFYTLRDCRIWTLAEAEALEACRMWKGAQPLGRRPDRRDRRLRRAGPAEAQARLTGTVSSPCSYISRGMCQSSV